jgi:hypothetical protein
MAHTTETEGLAPHERRRTVLGLGLVIAGLSAMSWPLFVVGRLGFLCSPPASAMEHAICADGISYLNSVVHIGVASAIAVALVLMAHRVSASQSGRATRLLFAATALTGPALITFVVIDSPPVDFSPAGLALAVACLSAALCIASASADPMLARRILAIASIVVAVAGVILEPGVASPLLITAAVAATAGVATRRS